MITVHKFGGGILRGAEGYGRAAKILESYGPGQLAVVSALHGVTDALDHAAKDHAGCQVGPFIQELLHRHLTLLESLQTPGVKEDAARKITEKIDRLSKILYGIYLLDELTPRTLDLTHSFGERLSADVLNAHVLDRKVASQRFDTDEVKLATDGRFANAVPDFDACEANFKRDLCDPIARGTVVLTGYFGISPDGHVTTLGRGGSDFSAGIAAYALDASRLVVWKDVSGFMSADPNVVADAKLIPVLSYEEAEELGEFGAKILHAKTMAPLRRKKIPVEIRSVYHPDVIGSLIGEQGKQSGAVAKSVAIKKNAALLSIHGGALQSVSSVAYPLFDQLRTQDVPIDAICTAQSDLSLCFESGLLPSIMNALDKAQVPAQSVAVDENASILALVGEGMDHTPGVSKRLFRSLADAGVNVRMICQGASEISITVVIARTDADKALKAVHAEFIEKRQCNG